MEVVERPTCIPCFFDCGFDPKWSEDGNIFYAEHCSNLWDCANVVYQYAMHLIFTLFSYVNFYSEDRNIRHAILSAACVETDFSQAVENQFSYGIHHFYDQNFERLYSLEHGFLQTIDKLYKVMFQEEGHPQRLFPSEMLIPIHPINRPQNESLTPESYLNGTLYCENSDLSRTRTNAFIRLRNPPSYHNVRHHSHFVDHAEYIRATVPAANALKHEMRELRKTLQKVTKEFFTAVNITRTKQLVAENLTQFHVAWNRYVQSHGVLQEAHAVFSQHDPLAQYYDLAARTSYCFWSYADQRDAASTQGGYVNLERIIRTEYSSTFTAQLMEDHPYEQ